MGKWAWMGALGLALAGVAPVEAAPPAPKLVVAISVDQFAADLFHHYQSSYTGGLKRLGDGIAFTGYQSHAATETCPGHSTILTGRHPAGTGIVANTWFDAKTGSSIYCVSVKGTADPDARGPQNLKATTYGDWLKKASPANRVYAVSGKDRAAITMGGHKADAEYWWNDGVGFYTSSSAPGGTPATKAIAAAQNKLLQAQWKAHPPELWPALPASCGKLQKPFQFGKITLDGKVPPQIARGVETGDFWVKTDFAAALHASPLFDTTVLDFADKLIDMHKLGHGAGIDLLAVSFSATDYVGHAFGGGGAEMCGQMAALDQTLGRFLAKLDSLHVPYMVVLTADHGGSDAAERLKAEGVDAVRIDSAVFVKKLNDAVDKKLNLGFESIVGDDPQQLTINVGPNEELRGKVRDAAVKWLKDQPEVAKVFTADEIRAAVPPKGKPVTELSFLERFNESYDAERSGDIQVAFVEHATIGMPRSPGDYVSGHGTPWDYDRRVPILFWWPGVTGDARKEPIETVDIAPTLAGITGTPTPEVDGRCLTVVAGVCR